MRLPGERDLRLARELAEVAMADAALRLLADALLHEHHNLDVGENDPPSVHAARRLCDAARRLRIDLRSYRRIVLTPGLPPDDGLPF